MKKTILLFPISPSFFKCWHTPAQPDYFFKTLLIRDGKGYHTIAFLCPNNDKPITIKEAACTADKVELLTKSDFYSFLPDNSETVIESQIEMTLLNLYTTSKIHK